MPFTSAQHSEGTGDLVLLHGAGVASEATWYPMLPELKSFRRIICPDLRGMGRSHSLDFIDRPVTVDEVVDDVLAILTHYSIDQRQMVGYSCGGLVALLVNAARRELVCGLVLLEPSPSRAAVLGCAARRSRALRRRCGRALVREDDPSIGVRQFLDLIAPQSFGASARRADDRAASGRSSRRSGLCFDGGQRGRLARRCGRSASSVPPRRSV